MRSADGRELLPLAFEELGAHDARELGALKQQISAAVGFPVGSYKEKYLRRRLAVRMRARGVHSYGAYADVLAHDPPEYQRLVSTLTIKVSKFYRNPEVWEAVRTSVLPALFAQFPGPLRVWSAGCAGGEEAYTLNIMLREHAAGREETAWTVLGTDIDAAALDHAVHGEYAGFAISDTPAAALARWFSPGPPYRLRAEARDGVRFEQLDLLHDPLPRRQHLVCCRNVIIYIDRPLQEALFERLHDALVPGGFLVLGKVEALSGNARRLFSTVSARHRIFRRHGHTSPDV